VEVEGEGEVNRDVLVPGLVLVGEIKRRGRGRRRRSA
jgi:hypothetical protein